MVRTRGNLRYMYYLTMKDGRQREVCCGREGQSKTRQKALGAEIRDLEDRARALRNRIKILRAELKELKAA